MYLIFGGESYYASGGANDLIEAHDDKSCAIQRAIELLGMYAIEYESPIDDEWDNDEGCKIEWTQVYSVESGEVIYKSDGVPHGESNGIIKVTKDDPND